MSERRVLCALGVAPASGFAFARVVALALVLAHAMTCAACKRAKPTGPASAAARATAVSPGASSTRTLASATAFDLATFADGALLAWAAPHAQGGGIWLQPLGLRGAVREPARRVAQTDAGGEVIELAAGAVGRRAGIAWLETDANESRTRALLLLPDEPAPPEPTRIATGAPAASASRTHLALAGTAEGRLRVLYADAPTACVDPASGPCIGYGFREIGPGARPLGGQWLAVPQPCTRGAPSLSMRGDRLYYAVCSTQQNAPSTVAYSINVATEYARADEVLPGCDPLGMLALDDGALLVADCNGVRRAVELTLLPQPPLERDLSARELTCDGDDVPSVRAGDFQLLLRGARDRLESVLPDDLAPPGARAVWTGRVLLIAHPTPGGLELVRLACQAGALRPAADP